MKTLLKLTTILVHQANFLYECKKYDDKVSFEASLKHTPLLYILSIHILYELNNKSIVLIELKSKNGKDWKVYLMYKPIFSFECIKQKEFMSMFERQLYQKLEKIDLFSTMSIE
jgi:hypothetical protein